MPVPRSDRNRVDLVGDVAGPVRVRAFDSGATLMSFAVRTRASGESPPTENVPVAWWAPALLESELPEGRRVRVQGRVRRRFFTGASGLRSADEVVATRVEV